MPSPAGRQRGRYAWRGAPRQREIRGSENSTFMVGLTHSTRINLRHAEALAVQNPNRSGFSALEDPESGPPPYRLLPRPPLDPLETRLETLVEGAIPLRDRGTEGRFALPIQGITHYNSFHINQPLWQ